MIALTTTLPEDAGARFALAGSAEGVDLRIDASSGSITAKSHSTSLPGKRDISVLVEYADGTFETVPAQLLVKTAAGNDRMSQDEQLQPLQLTGKPGEVVAGAIERPRNAEAARFRLAKGTWDATIDATGVFTTTIPAEAQEGESQTFTVDVTYADGSVNKVSVTVSAAKAEDDAPSSPTEPQKPTGDAPDADGSSVARVLPIVLGVLVLIGGAAFAVAENQHIIRNFARQFGIHI